MYTIEYSDEAENAFRKLDLVIARRIALKIRWLAAHVETIPHTELKGQLSGLCRLRVGDYRVLYQIRRDIDLVFIEVIGHRRNVYDE